jgi:hypothetical protein
MYRFSGLVTTVHTTVLKVPNQGSFVQNNADLSEDKETRMKDFRILNLWELQKSDSDFNFSVRSSDAAKCELNRCSFEYCCVRELPKTVPCRQILLSGCRESEGSWLPRSHSASQFHILSQLEKIGKPHPLYYDQHTTSPQMWGIKVTLSAWWEFCVCFWWVVHGVWGCRWHKTTRSSDAALISQILQDESNGTNFARKKSRTWLTSFTFPQIGHFLLFFLIK